LREQNLDGDRSVEQLIPSQEDVCHPATSDAAMKLVAAAENGASGRGVSHNITMLLIRAT
jgi:hypothetical protein